MKSIILRSPAKINLTLDILGKDERSGKHFVNTILYRDDDLFDTIEFRPILEKKNILICAHPDIPKDSSNLILKALDLLGIQGYEILLRKKIPVASGLAGGSSNAGTVLKFFGKKMLIPQERLLQIASMIGADVSFFVLEDNLAYFEGFGDQLIQSWNIEPFPVTIINTDIHVSTEQAYKELDLNLCGKNSVKTEALLKLFPTANYQLQTTNDKLLHNDFESSFFKKYPSLQKKGHLCGSGGFLWY